MLLQRGAVGGYFMASAASAEPALRGDFSPARAIVHPCVGASIRGQESDLPTAVQSQEMVTVVCAEMLWRLLPLVSQSSAPATTVSCWPP